MVQPIRQLSVFLEDFPKVFLSFQKACIDAESAVLGIQWAAYPALATIDVKGRVKGCLR